MTTSNRKPINLRDGNTKATIWLNESEKGTFYSVTFSRTYKDENGYHDATNFSGIELLKLSRLAAKAYDEIAALRSDDANDEGGQ